MKPFIYFIKEESSACILKLNQSYNDDFIKEATSKIRNSYIRDDELIEQAKKMNMSNNEVLSAYLPTTHIIRVGDFGEIITQSLIKEINSANFDIDKWLIKEDKNTSLRGTDCVVFHLDSSDSKKDFLVSAEVKSKTSEDGYDDPLGKAIEGRSKDQSGTKRNKISRLVRTLDWLKDVCVKKGFKDDLEKLKRFLKPVENTYKKHYKAVVFIDELFLEQVKTELLGCGIDHNDIMIVSFKDYRDLCEKIYA